MSSRDGDAFTGPGRQSEAFGADDQAAAGWCRRRRCRPRRARAGGERSDRSTGTPRPGRRRRSPSRRPPRPSGNDGCDGRDDGSSRPLPVRLVVRYRSRLGRGGCATCSSQRTRRADLPAHGRLDRPGASAGRRCPGSSSVGRLRRRPDHRHPPGAVHRHRADDVAGGRPHGAGTELVGQVARASSGCSTIGTPALAATSSIGRPATRRLPARLRGRLVGELHVLQVEAGSRRGGSAMIAARRCRRMRPRGRRSRSWPGRASTVGPIRSRRGPGGRRAQRASRQAARSSVPDDDRLDPHRASSGRVRHLAHDLPPEVGEPVGDGHAPAARTTPRVSSADSSPRSHRKAVARSSTARRTAVARSRSAPGVRRGGVRARPFAPRLGRARSPPPTSTALAVDGEDGAGQDVVRASRRSAGHERRAPRAAGRATRR